MKVEVAVLGLIVPTVCVYVKQHWTGFKAQELCQIRGGGPYSTYGLCGRKATLNRLRAQELRV